MTAPTAAAAVIHSLFGGDPNERLPRLRTGERDAISPEVRRGVWIRDGGKCSWCQRSDRQQMQLDHIIPWSAGGSDRSDNLRVLCADCNDDRSNFRTDAFVARPLPVSWWCVRCYFDDDEPYELEDPARLFCAQCRLGGLGERSWTS